MRTECWRKSGGNLSPCTGGAQLFIYFYSSCTIFPKLKSQEQWTNWLSAILFSVQTAGPSLQPADWHPNQKPDAFCLFVFRLLQELLFPQGWWRYFQITKSAKKGTFWRLNKPVCWWVMWHSTCTSQYFLWISAETESLIFWLNSAHGSQFLDQGGQSFASVRAMQWIS